MNSEPRPGARHSRVVRSLRGSTAVIGLLAAFGRGPLAAQTPSGPLVVFNAGSLAQPFRDLLRAFRDQYPDVVPAQENSGSVEAARKLTELGKIPDVLGVADYNVIPALLIPDHATWYVNDVLHYAHTYGGGTGQGDLTTCPTTGDGTPHSLR